MFSRMGFIFPPRWLPVIDGEFLDNPEDAFIPVSPYSPEGVAVFNSVPFMFGTTSGEGILLTANFPGQKEYAAKLENELDVVIAETVFGR